MKVLIVDDTPRARQCMKALLGIWFPLEEVGEAVNGIEAVQLTGQFQPKLVLMDIRLPGLSGLQATRQIKCSWPQVKIILLSVFSDYQGLAKAAGADAFVCKSDPPETLHHLLKLSLYL